jgi:hypothetical protein
MGKGSRKPLKLCVSFAGIEMNRMRLAAVRAADGYARDVPE